MNNETRNVKAVNISKGGTLIAGQIEWAGTSESRRKGLLGRDGLGQDEGIYIVPCGWVHTFKMRFPIDVAFIDKSGKVLSIQCDLKPNRLSKLILRSHGVLELAAGRLKDTGTAPGDIIQFIS